MDGQRIGQWTIDPKIFRFRRFSRIRSGQSNFGRLVSHYTRAENGDILRHDLVLPNENLSFKTIPADRVRANGNYWKVLVSLARRPKSILLQELCDQPGPTSLVVRA